ncbi:MAG: hypothetical protein IJ877_06155 [Candidatus Gastranaerophilales bacterium]|nr:hypothetical protein [Candidatus Gastranaerophilales bacterium]
MKKLQISKEHRALIESVIRESSQFKGHEYLIDAFCDAIYKKSYLLIDAIRDMSRLRRHLLMISDSCIEQIIKEKRKYDESRLYDEIIQKANYKKDIVSLKKDDVLYDRENTELAPKRNKSGIVNLKEEIQRSEKYNAVDNLIDPLEYCPQKRVSENTVDKLVKIVKMIDKQYPKKRYYDIFSLRYIKRYNQTEIARSMKISQIELSKRFVELIKLTKDNT